MSSDTAKKKLQNSNAVIENTVPAPSLQAMEDDFENPNVGETFGGNYPRLELAEGQVSPLLEYVKDTKVQVENDNGVEIITAPVCKSLDDGKLYALPINSIFKKHFKEANVEVGDTFKTKRYIDAVKKRGKGAGNKLKVFAVKVYTRKNPAPAATA